MKLPTLPDICIEALEIEKQLLETGELTPELELRSDENKLMIAQKLDHYYHAHENLGDKVKRLKETKKQIDLAVKRYESSQESLISRLEYYKTQIGLLKGENGEWVEKESKSIEVTNLDLLPMDCVRVKTEPDKIRIKERLDAGEEIQGVEILISRTLKYKRNK